MSPAVAGGFFTTSATWEADYLTVVFFSAFYIFHSILFMSFPRVSDSKVSACNAGDPGWISGLGISPGEGNEYPLQYSCLENSMDRGA